MDYFDLDLTELLPVKPTKEGSSEQEQQVETLRRHGALVASSSGDNEGEGDRQTSPMYAPPQLDLEETSPQHQSSLSGTGSLVGGGTRETAELMCRYEVGPQETLWSIARHFYGDGSRWRDIYMVNRARIADPDRLVPGTIILIPG